MMSLIFAFTTLLLATAPYSVKNYDHLIGMKGFSNQLLTMHFKLYEGYVKNTNDLTLQLQSSKLSPLEYGALKRRLAWEFNGMRLHELYFDNLGSNGQPDPSGLLEQSLAKQWGSFDAWKEEFIKTGSMRGIGWVILYRDPETGRLINAWIEEHDTGHLAGSSPILVMDVFEHAYMPQYGLDRAAYINAFFANLNWEIAEERFAAKRSK